MKIQRLLLIREIQWCGRLLISLLLFFRMWLESRRFVRLIRAAPAIVLMTAFAWAVVVSQLRNRDPALLEHYLTRARQAASQGDVQETRLLFRRAQQLAPADVSITHELAESLFQQGARPEAYQLLSSIAPSRQSGYLPAHRFLAQHPPDLKQVPQDYFRAIHLSHLVRNAAETREERIQLLQMLGRYRRFDDVENLIRGALTRYPEDQLFLAQLKFREGDRSGARQETEKACRTLSALVEKEPQKADRRIQLAQGYVFLARFADAICVMSEGITLAGMLLDHAATDIVAERPSADPSAAPSAERQKLASTLSHIYFAWINTLPAADQEMQLQCLQQMVLPEVEESLERGHSKDLQTQLHAALLNPATSWILRAMEGTARAARGELPEAEHEYRQVLQLCANEPTVANNLAWVILEQTRQAPRGADQSVQQARLQEALECSERAVSEMPHIASFLETRGQIHAALGNYAEAIRDLSECQKLGKDSPNIQRTLKLATQAVRQ